MMHVPPETKVTALPKTEQINGVVEVKPTATPEVALATNAAGTAPKVTSNGWVKVIVFIKGAIVKLVAVDVLVRLLASPLYTAVTVCGPSAKVDVVKLALPKVVNVANTVLPSKI